MLVFGQGALLFAFGDQVEGGIVVVFGLLAGVVGHEAKILTGLKAVVSRRSSVVKPQRCPRDDFGFYD